MYSFRLTAVVSRVPLIADCYLMSDVNLYHAQNSRLQIVADLHVINVTTFLSFEFFRGLDKMPIDKSLYF